MLNAVGEYVAAELINRGRSSLIYRARHRVNGGSFILKCLRDIDPSPESVAWFAQEHQITQAMQMDHIVGLLGLDWDGQRPFMVLEDCGGQSLDRMIPAGPFDLGKVLGLAIDVAQALDKIHARNAVHKDVNPSNIILNPASEHLELIDFGSATVLRQEKPSFGTLDAIEGTLAYIAPEQTGRINRPIDYRSDYYSLGVTLYELVTGRLPFTGATPMEIVHAHIAVEPTPPSAIRPDVPEILSDIILTLMAKEPEDRYHSAASLIYDIERFASAFGRSGASTTFPLREQDVFNRLTFSNRLYGREPDVARLLEAFERSRDDGAMVQMLLVGGQPGIGKSSLVREIAKPVTLSDGYFVSGKFEQYRRDIPYGALIHALRQLLKLVLAEDGDKGRSQRDRITNALGRNCQLLTEMLPELELIVGPQTATVRDELRDSRDHINLLLLDLISALTGAGRSVVIFLDDCQWSDPASLSFLKLLMSTRQVSNLLVVAAVRSGEVGDDHPFTDLLDELSERGADIAAIELGPLTVRDVASMLADGLGVPIGQVGDLAALIRRATAGNPFFIHQLVAKLSRDQQIYFDNAAREWRWDLENIAANEVIENVVQLMTAEIDAVDPQAASILRVAACVGTVFDLRMLARIHGTPIREVAELLVPAFQNGWIVPLDKQHQLVRVAELDLPRETAIECRFGHDRIRQAMYSSIDDADVRRLHWQIGQVLLADPGANRDINRILDIADHLNRGLDPEEAAKHAGTLLEINLAAGQRARTAGAHAASFDYFARAVSCSGAQDWQDRPDTARQLFEGAAEAAFLVGAEVAMQAWTEELLRRAEDAVQRSAAVEIRVRAALGRADRQAAVAIAMEALAEFGGNLSRTPDQAEMDAAIAGVYEALAGRAVSDLRDLPRMTDVRSLAQMQLYHSILAATYTNYPELFVVLSSQMVRLTIEHGLSEMSVGAFADFSIVLCGRLQEFELGYEFGKTAIELVDRLSARNFEAKARFMFNAFVLHWTEHLDRTLDPQRDVHRIAVQIGDLQYAAIAIFDYCFNLFWLGVPLPRLERELARAQEAIIRTNQEWILALNSIYRQAVTDLSSTTSISASLVGEHFDAESRLPGLEAAKASNTVVQIRILRMMLSYLFGDIDAALAEAVEARAHLSGVTGTTAVPSFHFYWALARLADARRAGATDLATALDQIEESRAQLRYFADRAPMNYRHKHLLVEAEIADLEGRGADATMLYEEAIELASENGYLMEEALACERASTSLLARGQTRRARHFMRDALDTWLKCGAHAKVKHLGDASDLLTGRIGEVPPGTVTATQLDFSTVLQATQAISSEIVLPRLLKKLMSVLIENAGATRGFLLLPEGDGWVVEAEARVAADNIEMQPVVHRLIDPRNAPVPMSIVEAAVSERRNVIIQDSRGDHRLTEDPYFEHAAAKSILCHPILKQSAVSGVLYLENELVAGAFSEDRLAVLQPLSGQAAISIENAKLLEHQVNLTAAANRFVPDQLAKVLGRKSLADVQLGDHEQREMLFLATDIRQFTARSENMPPKELFEFVNAYLKATDPIFYDHGGIIVKFGGDSQLAVFLDGVDAAIDAAIAIQARVAEFDRQQQALGHDAFGIGIGLHVGPSMLGIVGDQRRFQLDVLSDSVNLVARIETLTRIFGARTIASETVIDRLRFPEKYTLRSFGFHQVKGRREATKIFQILDAEPEPSRCLMIRTRGAFEDGIMHLHAGDRARAVARFAQVIESNPGDTAAHYHLRIAEGGVGEDPTDKD